MEDKNDLKMSTLLQAHCQSPTIQRFYLSFVKELAKPARVTTFQDGLRIAHAQKNKINLCFVDRLVQFDNDKNAKLNGWQTDGCE
ncbi:MAG: hypothetical protein PHT17_00250 [Proteiniphilum sp.]|nr:hypothetical protein [Proteiniphilum sp.]